MIAQNRPGKKSDAGTEGQIDRGPHRELADPAAHGSHPALPQELGLDCQRLVEFLIQPLPLLLKFFELHR